MVDIVRARASLFFTMELLFNVHHLVVGLVVSHVDRLDGQLRPPPLPTTVRLVFV